MSSNPAMFTLPPPTSRASTPALAAHASTGRPALRDAIRRHRPAAGGQSQIWSRHNADGPRVTTMETQIITGEDSAARIRLGQHAGPRNIRPPKKAVKAEQELLHILAARPQVMQCYLDWKNITARTPISERRLAASVGVIITALNEVLPARWGLEIMTPRSAEEADGTGT